MKWQGRRRSSNVEDRRGRRVPGGRQTTVGGGVVIIAVIAALLFGVDPTRILGLLAGGPADPSVNAGDTYGSDEAGAAASDATTEFVSVVLASTEDAWVNQFDAAGETYRPPRLILYNDAVESACGYSTSATGPFYCPGDDQVYIDLSFLRELEQMGAPGDFAFAYVVAHEVGHHVQNLIGVERRVRSLSGQASESQANALSVLTELQADCFAGIWAHAANAESGFIEDGDIEEGLRAASAVGDDRLQRAAGRRVQPESFTHGSSAQRVEWFRRGLETGSVGECDTFADAGIR